MSPKDDAKIISINDLKAAEQRDQQNRSNGIAMLSMARDADITMNESDLETGQSRGNCPFHNPPTPTFAINVNSGRFHCIYCRRAGGIAAMAAHLWKVSTNDALRNLRHLSEAPPGRRPTPKLTPANPNSAVINRLMVHFNRDMALNPHAANICARLGLNPTKLADHDIGWCWPGRSMDHLLEQEITLGELENSDLLNTDENGVWTTTMPSGFVIPDLDRNRLATNVIGYDTFRGEAFFPSRRRPESVGADRLPNQAEHIHVTNEPLLYLKALELDLTAVLTCNHRTIRQAAQDISANHPHAVSLYISSKHAVGQFLDVVNTPSAKPDEALSRFQYMLPRRIANLTGRTRLRKQEKNDDDARKAVPPGESPGTTTHHGRRAPRRR